MVILWLVAVELLGLAALPLTLAFFPRLADRGYGLARTLGILIITWANWLLGTALGAANVVVLLWLLALALAALGWWALRRRGEDLRAILSGLRGAIARHEALFLAAFAVWTLVRAYHPDIFGTEKPMDLMYLTTSMEHHRFAPPDLWLSGTTINYYYLGYLAMATVANMAAASPPVAFNLALALIFALTLGGAYSLGLTLTRSYRWALLAPAFVGLAGNLAGWMQVWGNLTSGVASWAHVDAWCASRVIGGCGNYTTINEFPFFSFVLGDLHPHLIALPFALLCLAIAVHVMLAPDFGVRAFGPPPLSWLMLGLAALTLGSLYAINSWDLPAYLLLVALALAAAPFVRGASLAASLRRAAPAAGALALCSILLWLPFWLGYHSSARGVGVQPAATNVGEYLVVNGAFLIPLVIFLLALTAPSLWRRVAALAQAPASAAPTVSAPGPAPAPAPVSAAFDGGEAVDEQVVLPGGAWRPLALVAVAAGVLVLIHGSLTLLSLLVLALIGYHLLGPRREGDPLAAFAWLATALALGLTVMTEFVYLRDIFDGGANYRMNTVFKFYYEIWILLAVAAAWAFPAAWRWAGARLPASGRRSPWQVVWGALLAVVLLTTGTFTLLAVPSSAPSQGAVPTLDGMAYLQTAAPADYRAIAWLRANAPRDAVVAEAVGGDYWGFGPPPPRPGQVATFSGLPTLLEAAASHEGLWHPGDPAIAAHQAAAAAIYGPDAAAARAAIAQNDVRYVYVGRQEALTYARGDLAAPNLTKFGAVMHLRPVYRDGEVTIYQA